MTAAMPGYGAELPDNLVLGHIAWYTITQPQVTQPELADIVTTLGLSPHIIPERTTTRGCIQTSLPIQRTEWATTTHCRRHGQLPDPTRHSRQHRRLERHLVLERVDALGKVLDYTTAAKLTFDRKDKKLHVAKRTCHQNNQMVIETLNMFHDNFEFALEFIDAQRIRSMVREQLTIMRAIAIRRQGSVYFVPIKEKTRTLALEQFCTQMGTGSVFHSIPLPDTTKQREMIHQAFQDEVHEEASQLITELRRIHAADKVITAKAWIDYQKKLKQLQANFGVYGDMVGLEMGKAELELEAVNKQLRNLMSEGKVKS